MAVSDQARSGDLAETFKSERETTKNQIRVALPGIVQSFDPDAVTAVVQPAIRSVEIDNDGNRVTKPYPLLVDVPVVFPRGGGCTLTFPVKAGDECLVIFADRCIDFWWQNGGVQEPVDDRVHDLSDAFCIVGPQSQAQKISGISTSAAQLRTDDGAAFVEVAAGHNVTVKTPGALAATAEGGTTITSPTITLNGDVTINGNLSQGMGEGGGSATMLGPVTVTKASSAQVNKALRQASFIAAALAQYTASKSGQDVLDDGDLSGFIAKMSAAFGKDFQTLDATLTALAGLATGADKLPYFTGNDTAGQTDLTSVGRDIIGKASIADILTYLGLGETAKQAAGAVQKIGDEMSGKLTLPQTSSFGVNINNILGGSSIAIGDNDTGLKGNGDGNLAFMANNVLAGFFNENELQHSKKMLTKNFQALVDNNWPEGAGGFSGQLSSEAPFSVPMVHRQNNDNNFFPLLKGKVSLESGYPVAASFGILTSGNTNFPQIAIHAKTDFDVNDKIWIFDVATGEFRVPGRITATEILLSGKSRVAPDGNLYGDVWGGWLNDFLNNNYNRKNTASLGDYGWVRDESTGFIMQWGTLGSSNGTYNFPREFPASCFAVFVTNTNQQGGSVDNAFGYPVSKSQFFAATKASTDGNVVNGYPVAWFAIGR